MSQASKTAAPGSTTTVPLVRLSGTPEEIGLAHGKALAARIEQTVDLYRLLLGLDDAQVAQAAAHFQDVIKDFAPHLATEMDAIADGAKQPAHWIYLINARSEILSRGFPECTALYTPHTGALAQNWDWIEPFEELFCVLDITHTDGRRLLTVTEPGMVGKIGLNATGLGVCLNFLMVNAKLDGVPVHVLLRDVLDCTSLAAADTRLGDAGAGRAGNVLVGSAGGRGVNYEFLGGEARRTELAAGTFVHTNHALGDTQPGDPVFDNSDARLQTVERILGNGQASGLEDMESILTDASHEEHPVCRPYTEAMGVPLGTVCAVFMDLPGGTMRVRKGPDPATPATDYSLSA